MQVTWQPEFFFTYYPRQEPYEVVPHVRICGGYGATGILEALKKEICPENCPEVCQETSPGICQKGKTFFWTIFLSKTSEACQLFGEFAMNCLDDIAEANKFDLKPEVISIPEPPKYKEIKFPFFIQRSEDE